MAWPQRTGSPTDVLPPGSRLGPRWGVAAWQGRTAVGLDLGGGSLKLVQLSWNRQAARVETFAWVPLPAGSLEEGVITNPAELGALLRAVWTHLGIRQRNVIACVSGLGVMMRPVQMPAVGPAELKEAMVYEAPQYLPIAEADLVMDYALLDRDDAVPEGQMMVFLAGTHRRLVRSYLDACAQARLRLDVLEVECLSGLRALSGTGRIHAGTWQALAVLECGELSFGLTIYRRGIPVLTRTIPGGMAELRATVAEELGLPVADAQGRILSEGLAPDGLVAACAQAWLRPAIEAVARSVEFFLIQHRGTALERMYLYGPWAQTPHLSAVLQFHLTETLGSRAGGTEPFRVQVADLAGFPMSPGVEMAAHAAGPALLAALGAALRGVPEA